MKKWRWMAAVALSFVIAFFIVAAFIYTPEEEPSPEYNVSEQTKETNPAQQQIEPEEDEQESEAKEGKLSEGLREVFTGVIENARNVFLKDDLQIVAIGDSLTQGVGDSTENGGYIGILEETFNANPNTETLDITNYGKRGNRTDHMLERMEDEQIADSLQEADLILITIGANDVMKVVKNNFTSLNYQDFVEEQVGYEDRMREIFSRVQELNPDAPVYLLGLYNPFNQYFTNIPELGQIMGDWNDISRQVTNDYEQATFIPIRDLFEGNEEELLWEEDLFHPNERGYKKMAERVLQYIREDIEQ
ncbi:SGNH/GDSL hydrolase family protein [Halobacillus sp. Nhm2S1]|uniref:SGNH/GDSL hydrolase family protein n=1 Tax=Halobacillus sp. Nhm2S1 TaxID=2866716 RepID=UPI001C72A086|nr:SGNH/GDSL hydrolase family protein [Halobacillus sp. Nhm2S1]MBX0358022.1 SGNH/GDSL hydrolase family protein [Halobacillus sp. Nhm2S1]